MGRTIIGILVLSMFLSMAACGAPADVPPATDPTQTPPPTEEPTETEQPTAEELQQLETYAECAKLLDQYVQTGDISYREGSNRYTNSMVLKQIYEKLLAMETVDLWLMRVDIGFGYEGMPRDRKKLLEGFHKLEDLYLYTVTTHSADYDTSVEIDKISDYDAEGRLIRGNRTSGQPDWIDYHDGGICSYHYDEQGRIAYFDFSNGRSVHMVVTPTYDGGGRIVSELLVSQPRASDYTYQAGEYLYEYTYDENGDMIKATWRESNYLYEVLITYCEPGHPETVQRNLCYQTEIGALPIKEETYQYTYDAAGNPNGMVYTRVAVSIERDTGETERILAAEETYVYTCDEKGRIISEDVTYTFVHQDNVPWEPYATIEHIYGDYWVYVPVV